MLMYQCNACAHKECDHFISLGKVCVRCKKCGANYSFEEETVNCIDWRSYFLEDDLNYTWKIASKLADRGELEKQSLWQMVKRRIHTADRLDRILEELHKRDMLRVVKEQNYKKEIVVINGERLLTV